MYTRADDARAGLRRRPALPADPAHGRHLAGVPDHPRRPHAPRRDRRRRGDRLPGRADQLRGAATPRPRSSGTRTARPTRCRTCSGKDAAARAARRRAAAARRRASPCSGFHDTLLRNGSLPISFHRRLLRRRRAPSSRLERVLVIPAIDLDGGRSRVVYWPGAAAGIGAPTDRPGADRRAVRRRGRARSIHLVDFDGARAGAPGEPRGGRAGRVAGRGPDPGRRRRRAGRRRSGWRSRPARRASSWRWRSPTGPTTSRRASRSPATGWPSGSIRGPSGSPRFRGGGRRATDRRASSSASWPARACGGSS